MLYRVGDELRFDRLNENLVGLVFTLLSVVVHARKSVTCSHHCDSPDKSFSIAIAPWGVKVANVEVKQVDLPESMLRANGQASRSGARKAVEDHPC
jgi:hypothetical protein